MAVLADLPVAPCPKCTTLVPLIAEFCPRCRTVLRETPVVPPDELAGFVQQIAAFTADASAPIEPETLPTFRMASHVLGALAIALLLLAVLDLDLVSSILGWIFGAIFAIAAAVYYIGDLTFRGVRERRSGLDAATCYVRALRSARWHDALACLSPIARTRISPRPAIRILECPEADIELDSAQNLRRYWRPLVRASGGRSRRIAGWRLAPISSGPTHQRYMLTLRIHTYSSWVVLLVFIGLIGWLALLFLQSNKVHTISYPITVLEHRSRWWMLSGELYPRIDRALVQQP